MGCTVSRGFGPKCFLGTNRGKKLIGKQQSTLSKAELPKNINCIALGRKQENKGVLIKIEKVDDRIIREMGKNLNDNKENTLKADKKDRKEKNSSKVNSNNTEGSQYQKVYEEPCGEMLKATKTNDIKKLSRKELPMNHRSTDDDDALLTFGDLKNTQKTSEDSGNSSEAESNSKSSSDDENSKGDNDDSKEEENEDDEVVEDNEYEDDSKSLNSTKEEIEIPKKNSDKKKEITSSKSIAARVKDYSKKIGQQGIICSFDKL